MKKASILIAALMLAVFGCSKKTTKLPKSAAEIQAEKIVAARKQGPQPGIEFFETNKQQRYEALFRDSLKLFEPPAAGTFRWIKLYDGRIVGGRVGGTAPGEIAIFNGDDTVVYRIADMAMESRSRIFEAEFARDRAMGLMTGELREPSAVQPTNSMTRYAVSDEIVARVGPGPEFRRVPEATFLKGHPVTFCEERDGWLRLKDAPENEPRWIPKFLTYPLQELDRDGLKPDIEQLTRAGLIQNINVQENEVDVNPAIWRGHEPEQRMGIARLMADFCAASRGNSMVFVTIRDKESQKKLGKYSQSQGWKAESTL
jgi:hypothetical protein